MNREHMIKTFSLLTAYREFTSDSHIANMCSEVIDAIDAELAKPVQEPVACVKKLNTMIIGCDDVISEDGVHKDAKSLAKLVKKDCYEILQNLEEKNSAL